MKRSREPVTSSQDDVDLLPLDYIKAVQEVFYKKNNTTFDEFHALLSDFMEERIEVKGVIAKVKKLFKGHPDLIMGFNIFLPEGQKITYMKRPKDDGNGIPFEYHEAMKFLNKIKMRFQNDDNCFYLTFLDILERYRNEDNFERIYKDAEKYCFSDHPDLLKELKRFLPNSSVKDSANDREQCKNPRTFEDDMSELDLFVENIDSTITSVDKLLEDMMSNPDNPICIKDYLKARHLRYIENLYSDLGLDVINVLRSNNPALALSTIQMRLRQKQEEWSTFRDEFICRVREENLM